MKKADAILCSDIHLREDQPTCRTDNFWEAQWQAIDFLSNLQKENNCIVIHGGDLFHHWKPSPYLLSTTIEHLPKQFYTILGQHDIPQHALNLFNKCGVRTLEEANKLKVLETCHWGQTPSNPSINIKNKKLLVWHHLAYIVSPFPGATGGQALSLLKKYNQFDLILTGDNHKTFIETYKGRILINPGSLTRQTAIQITHKPSVFLYYATDNTINQIYIPIKKDVISRQHIQIQEKRNMRIDAFVDKLNMGWEKGISFEDNLQQFFNTNKISKKVSSIIMKAIDKEVST